VLGLKFASCGVYKGENQMEEQSKVCDCPKCKEREEKEKVSEELNMAVLLAFVPLLVITLFGQIGLF
jgi:hypothetical protein